MKSIKAKKALGFASSLWDRQPIFAQIAQALNSSGFRTAKGLQYFPTQV